MHRNGKILLSIFSILFLLVILVLAYQADHAGTEIPSSYQPIVSPTYAETTTPSLSKHSLYCEYFAVSSGNTLADFNIYVPTVVGFYKINFRHSINASANYDIWRINKLSAVDDQLNLRYHITNSGEFEAAIKLLDRNDFSGGIMHGDERMQSLSLCLDGATTQIDKISNLTSFQEMLLSRTSVFYDPADHTQQIASHEVQYTINTDGIRVDQSVTWFVDEVCRASYMAMFPVLRTDTDDTGNTIIISEFYTDNATSEQYDVSTSGLSDYPQKWKKGVHKMILKSEALGLEASMDILNCSDIPGAGYSQCSPAEQYNKLYYSITGFGSATEYAVSKNDLWETSVQYTVSIQK